MESFEGAITEQHLPSDWHRCSQTTKSRDATSGDACHVSRTYMTDFNTVKISLFFIKRSKFKIMRPEYRYLIWVE